MRSNSYEVIEGSKISELKHSDSAEVITIDVANNYEILDVDRQIKEMKYIKLETNDKSLIGRIDKIVFHDNLVYVLDRSFSKSIHIFDMSGKHLSTINKSGRGPGEYLAIRDFCFQNNQLVLYDDLGGKFIYFDAFGEYLSYSKASFRFRSFAPFYDDNYIFVTRNADNTFYKEIDGFSMVIGTKDQLLYKGFPNSRFLSSFEQTLHNPISRYRDTYLFSPLLSNNIYQIEAEGKYTVKYTLNFERPLPDNYEEYTQNSDFDNYVKKGKYTYFMGKFAETKDHLLVSFNPPGDHYGYTLFNKSTAETTTYYLSNLPKLYLGFSPPICTFNDYFVASLEPTQLMSFENQDILKNKIGEISEKDNPILILYKFK